jgi:hypothetical protein
MCSIHATIEEKRQGVQDNCHGIQEKCRGEVGLLLIAWQGSFGGYAKISSPV